MSCVTLSMVVAVREIFLERGPQNSALNGSGTELSSGSGEGRHSTNKPNGGVCGSREWARLGQFQGAGVCMLTLWAWSCRGLGVAEGMKGSDRVRRARSCLGH